MLSQLCYCSHIYFDGLHSTFWLQLADHNDEAFARLDARLALAEQRMKTKLEDAKRRLLALDAGA